MTRDYSRVGLRTIVKPKTIVIKVEDKDGNVIDTVTSRTLDEYEVKYKNLYEIVEKLKEKFWKDLEGDPIEEHGSKVATAVAIDGDDENYVCPSCGKRVIHDLGCPRGLE
jgi:hypothetical protein